MGISVERTTIISARFRLFHIFLMVGSAFLLYSALGAGDDSAVGSEGLNLFITHRYFGLMWGAIVAGYAAHSLAGKRHRILEPLRKPLMDQIRESFSIIGRYFFGRRISQRVRQKMGRHNVLAAYAFLMMCLGIFLLGAGGIGLVATPHESSLYEIFLGVHILGAGLLSLFVLAHLFAVLNRENRPLLKAVFTSGKVPRRWAENSMPANNHRK